MDHTTTSKTTQKMLKTRSLLKAFTVLVAALVFAATASSCGDNSGFHPTNGELAVSISKNFAKEASTLEYRGDNCFGNAIVENLTIDRLQELDVTVENGGGAFKIAFTESEIEEIATSLDTCEYFSTALARQYTSENKVAACIALTIDKKSLALVVLRDIAGIEVPEDDGHLIAIFVSMHKCGLDI